MRMPRPIRRSPLTRSRMRLTFGRPRTFRPRAANEGVAQKPNESHRVESIRECLDPQDPPAEIEVEGRLENRPSAIEQRRLEAASFPERGLRHPNPLVPVAPSHRPVNNDGLPPKGGVRAGQNRSAPPTSSP